MTLDYLDKAFEKMISEFPDAKQKLIKQSGAKLYDKVIQNINTSVKTGRGNLKQGVTKVIGSKGGYVAIKTNWKRAPHTDLIENGHKIVTGKGSNKKVVGWVPGVHMYRNALLELADELETDAEKIINELVGDIFG